MPVCPHWRGKLIAGYVPAIALDNSTLLHCLDSATARHCPKPGVLSEVWRLVAEKFNCAVEFRIAAAYGPYRHEPNLSWTGVLGDVFSGRLDGTVSLLTISPERFDDFKSTNPFGTSAYDLIHRHNEDGARQLNLAVFSPVVFLVLIATIIINGLLSHATGKGNSSRTRRWWSWAYFFERIWICLTEVAQRQQKKTNWATAAVLILCAAMEMIYFAQFRYKLITSMAIEEYNADELFEQLRSGTRKLIIVKDADLKKNEKLKIFGTVDNLTEGKRLIIAGDREKALEILCSGWDLLLLARLRELITIADQHRFCRYLPIKLNTSYYSVPSDVITTEHILPDGLLLAKNISNKFLEAFNRVILTIFKDDDLQRFYHYGAVEIYQRPVSVNSFPNSISFTEIRTGFLFWLAGMFLSLGVFAASHLYHRKVVSITYLRMSFAEQLFIQKIEHNV